MSIADLSDGDFATTISHGLWAIHFWSPTCGPCKIVETMLPELQERFGERLQFGKVNAQQELKTAISMQVQSYPTLMVFRDGMPIDSILGARPLAVYQDRLERCVLT